MIVKIQLSTGGNVKQRMALIYDKSRQFELEVPAPVDWIEALKDKLKAFYDVDIVDGELIFKEELPDQGW